MQSLRFLKLAVVIATIAVAGGLVHVETATACPMASQEQLFPLGTVDGDLLALSVVQHRDGKLRSEWTVQTSVVRVAPGGGIQTISKRNPRVFTRHAHHERAVKHDLAAALLRAKRSKGFRPIIMSNRVHCEHTATCGGASLSAAGKDLRVTLHRRASATVRASQLDALYNRPGDYDIAAVRTFRGTGGTWSVVDIRAGDPRCSSLVDRKAALACAKTKRASRPGLAIAASYEWRSVYHHGFDKSVLLWRPVK